MRMQRASFLFIGAGLLVSAGIAFADEPPPAGGGGGDATGAGAGSGSAAASATAATTPGAEGGWDQLDTRPLVIPQGKAEAHLGVPIVASQSTNAMGMTSTNTLEVLSIGGTFGVADKLEVGGDYAFRLNPDASGKGVISVHGAYAAMSNEKMELAVAGSVLFNLSGVDAMGNSTTDIALDIGAWFRYHVAPKFSVFTGQPPIPFTLGGFSTFLAPPQGYQLGIGLNNSQPIVLSLPAGAMFQATPQLNVFAALDLADIYLSNGPVSSVNPMTGAVSRKTANVIFADFIPLGVGAFFSPTKQLDLGVEFADDLNHAGDFYIITFAGRFYVK